LTHMESAGAEHPKVTSLTSAFCGRCSVTSTDPMTTLPMGAEKLDELEIETCAECGERVRTNPNNDCCDKCEERIRSHAQQESK